MSLPWNTDASTTLSVDVGGHTFELAQRPASLDHAMTVWDAAVGFVRHLDANPRLRETFKAVNVVELGAGPGLVSLYLTRLCGARCIATDLPHVVPFTAAQGVLNGLPAGPGFGCFVAAPLAWGDPIDGVLSTLGSATSDGGAPRVDVVVATDTVFSSLLAPVLVQCGVSLLEAGRAARASATHKHPAPVFYVAMEVREEGCHAAFLSAAQAQCSVKKVKAALGNPNLLLYELKLRGGR